MVHVREFAGLVTELPKEIVGVNGGVNVIFSFRDFPLLV
jgi:hypothetical protein